MQVVIKKRGPRNEFREVWSIVVDPADAGVERGAPPKLNVWAVMQNGAPRDKVDLLLMGDGYTAAEMEKWHRDARRMAETLFAVSPFKEHRQDFNVWAVDTPAEESGVARPSDGIFRRSPLRAAYDAFGSERYVLTFDNKRLREAASAAPYEFIEIVVNDRKYGGGGIFNLFATVSADNAFTPYVFVHEFSLTDDDERIERLSSEQGAVERELSTLAAELSAARRAAADRFARAVAQELAGLAMPQARVLAEVRQPDLPDDRSDAGRRPAFGPYGLDDVAVLLAPHVGAPARPLHRGASGGELSRVMLAVEVVLAVADEHDRPVSTFVFDEVDAGVGGRAAVEVGRRLARLAAGTQVIVVTHLPQVAAYADRHLVVEKSSDACAVALPKTRARQSRRCRLGPSLRSRRWCATSCECAGRRAS